MVCLSRKELLVKMSAIISRSKGFIFLKVPKNASYTTTTILLEAGLASGRNDTTAPLNDDTASPAMKRVHPNMSDLLDQGLITQAEHDALPVYAFYRDPVDRFLSAYRFTKYVHPSGVNLGIGRDARVEFDLGFVIDNLSMLADRTVFFRHQSHWLAIPNITVYNFSTYREEMAKFRDMCGGGPVRFLDDTLQISADRYFIHNTDQHKPLVSLTATQASKVRDFYSKDYALQPTQMVAA
jgi:hypothetical protein